MTLLLTHRQHEVLALLAEGLSNKEIADRLLVTENTVKSQLYKLRQKMGARSRTHMAVLWAEEEQRMRGVV